MKYLSFLPFRNHQTIIPFRESKLTRLFQNFFLGKGKASMIVNISQCASVFDETYHVLKFSAVAKQVIWIELKLTLKLSLFFSSLYKNMGYLIFKNSILNEVTEQAFFFYGETSHEEQKIRLSLNKFKILNYQLR